MVLLKGFKIEICRDDRMDAKALIESIRDEKRKAIAVGVLREEKPLAEITKKDMPRELPDGWQWCRLGDYAMKVTDYVASGSFASLKKNVLITNEENYAVMVKTADFANGFTKNLTYTDEHGYRFLENSNLFGGELILSNIGSIGKVFIVPDLQRPMTLASNTVMIRMTHNEYNKYMYYLFISPFGQKLLKSISSGTSMLKFNKTQLKSTIIPIAPLEKQKEICEVLDKLQKIISDQRSELEKLDELIKARFVELFDDGLSPIKTVEEMCSAIVDCPHTTPKYEGDLRNPAIRTSEIKKGYITWDTMRYVSDEEYEERVARLRPKAGDIVYGREGTFGNAAILPAGYKFCLGQRVMLLRPDYSKCTSEYLLHAVISDDVYRQAVGKNNASTVAHVNVKDVKQFRVPLPSFEKQNEFAAFVKQVENVKYAVKESLTEIQTLFDSLMQEYFG